MDEVGFSPLLCCYKDLVSVLCFTILSGKSLLISFVRDLNTEIQDIFLAKIFELRETSDKADRAYDCSSCTDKYINPNIVFFISVYCTKWQHQIKVLSVIKQIRMFVWDHFWCVTEEVILSACERAFGLIDMRTHTGVHPCMGAVDLIPIYPLGEQVGVEDCANEARGEKWVGHVCLDHTAIKQCNLTAAWNSHCVSPHFWSRILTQMKHFNEPNFSAASSAVYQFHSLAAVSAAMCPAIKEQ